MPYGIGHTGPGAGLAPGPRLQQPPQYIYPNIGPPIAPGPPQPPRPPGSDIPLPNPVTQPAPMPQPPQGGGDMGWFGAGYGQTGGMIGPPTQEQALSSGPKPIDWSTWGMPQYGTQQITDQQIQSAYPGINQPAPRPYSPHSIRGKSGGPQPIGTGGRQRGIRGPRGGGRMPPKTMPRPPIGGGMGGGMGFGPMQPPFIPPNISGPYGGGGGPIFPAGTNPWDIPGARGPGGGPILPPGTNPWDIPGARGPGGGPILPPGSAAGGQPLDASGVVANNARITAEIKQRFRDYVAQGGDPYGPDAPRWM